MLARKLKDFMKYDATTLLRQNLRKEGDKAAIVEVKEK